MDAKPNTFYNRKCFSCHSNFISIGHFLLFFIVLFSSTPLFSHSKETLNLLNWSTEEEREKYYPLISKEVWEKVSPHLIPLDHKAKKFLDKIFSNDKVLSSIETLQKAGFQIIQYRRSKKIAVAIHPKLKRYIIKTYLDDHKQNEWTLWVHRVQGSHFVRSVIQKNNYHHLFKVPKKWIYAVPRKDTAENKNNPTLKNFVLVVENMNLIDKQEHLHKLQNEMSYKDLKILFKMISEIGYDDCHADNIPFCKDGRIAFIDLEYYKLWPIRFNSLTKYFSPAKQKYWQKLINSASQL